LYLNAGNIAHFLIGRGVVGAEAGDLSIIGSSRRNRNFKAAQSVCRISGRPVGGYRVSIDRPDNPAKPMCRFPAS
jgi:hypothetical protein